jgi:hypothetical protein
MRTAGGMAPNHKFDYGTKDALELARVIAGAKLCVMNQSLPLAIAHGLHKTVVIEEWSKNPNTRVERPGVYLGMPEGWLK